MAEFQMIIQINGDNPSKPISLEANNIDDATTKVVQAMANMEQEVFIQPKKKIRVITSKRGEQVWVRTIQSLN